MISSWSPRLRPRALPLNPSLSPLSSSHPWTPRPPLLVCHNTARMCRRSPPLFHSRNSFCVCYIVFLLTASSGEARTSAGTQKWYHLPRYSQYNQLWLLLYLQYSYPSSINCLPVVYQISSVYFASYYFYSHVLSTSSPPPPFFFLISSCFPLK